MTNTTEKHDAAHRYGSISFERHEADFRKFEERDRQRRERGQSLLEKHFARLQDLIDSVHDDSRFDYLHAKISGEIIADLEGLLPSKLLEIFRRDRTDPFTMLGSAGAKQLGLNLQLQPFLMTGAATPRRYYVYIHRDNDGKAFYVGKGRGSRAWCKRRYHIWSEYVTHFLNGCYDVEIAYENLSELAALAMETAVMSCFSHKQLANCANVFCESKAWYTRENWMREAPARHWRGVRASVKEAEKTEQVEPERALEVYLSALVELDSYSQWLIDKQDLENVRSLVHRRMMMESPHGDLEIIDRITTCLASMGRYKEAAEYSNRYFAKYRFDAKQVLGIRIQRRVACLAGQQVPDSVSARARSPKSSDQQLRLFDDH
jgi:hypothetical protein